MSQTVPGQWSDAAMATDILNDIISPIERKSLTLSRYKQVGTSTARAAKRWRQRTVCAKCGKQLTRCREYTLCCLYLWLSRPSVGGVVRRTKEKKTKLPY